jgi:hypothetical protein
MGLESDAQVRDMPKSDEDYKDDGECDKDLLMDG